MRTWLSILLVALLAGGCAERPDVNVWALTNASGQALIRAGVGLGEKADVGLEVSYADGIDELLMAGAYGVLDVGEPIVIPNPFPLTSLPAEFPAQGYIGAHLGWVDTLREDVEFNHTRIFGGPVAGLKIAGNENFAVVTEYQYRLGEGDNKSLGDLDMHSVLMFGAWIKF